MPAPSPAPKKSPHRCFGAWRRNGTGITPRCTLTYLAEGDRVATFGAYSGVYLKTGKSMTATFAHLFRLKDGKIVSMEQYVDSAMVQRAMQAD